MTALFETMLAIGGRLVQLDEHAARMARACRELRLAPLDEDAFREAARKVLRDGEHAVRVVHDDGQLSATAFAIPDVTRSRRARGCAVTVQARRTLPQYKRVPEDLELRRLIPPDADEALFVNGDGAILEGTSTNVFAMRGDTLITAPDGVLPGVVRAWVLSCGLPVEYRPPTVEEIRGGAFLTGSLTTLAPIRTLDGRACAPPGPAFAELVRSYGVPLRRP